MTRQERNDYKLKWARFHKRWEAIYVTKFKKALQVQVEQYIATRSITSTSIYAVLLELYTTVGPIWAARTGIHRLKPVAKVKALMPMGFSERIVALMRQRYNLDLLNDAELMTAHSREVIAKVLSDAAETGASLAEVVKQLTSHPEFNAMRARRIARTEVTNAGNLAALANAEESGIKMNKLWLSIHDKRTRHDHKEIDGRVIPTDDYFNLSGVTMKHPGARTQQNGLPVPGAQTINCRCTVAFESVTDERGRIVRS